VVQLVKQQEVHAACKNPSRKSPMILLWRLGLTQPNLTWTNLAKVGRLNKSERSSREALNVEVLNHFPAQNYNG